MTGAEALREAVLRLRAAGIEGAPGDARRLLAHALGLAPERLTLHLGDPLSEAEARAFAAAVASREARRPVSQIVGYRDFHGHRFRVTGAVLDPRPETELLVDLALAEPVARMLDLGTGSGCILLSCLAGMAAAEGEGADLSPAALEVAEANARALGLDRRARFLLSDWFSAVTGRFGLIVSNPPYIAEAEMEGLAPEVRGWEPHLALTPGGDGLGAYRAIVAGAGAHLEAGGRILMEIGPAQGAAVAGMLAAAGFAGVEVRRDLDGRDRVVAGRWPGGGG
ncbi:MAG: peptide chain release factor N(5)-glutamine methyltransferase [Proteobacteria bacterium]|nr:peptide chain release factor N(5)-glutamine methyltransferase [Pseudomonadota bacterium]MBS0572402.1 peptide chain release factor N(5)-glutamine methyltransferase [Pseudomonadota bacterium]